MYRYAMRDGGVGGGEDWSPTLEMIRLFPRWGTPTVPFLILAVEGTSNFCRTAEKAVPLYAEYG
jgi:hypothetical protein